MFCLRQIIKYIFTECQEDSVASVSRPDEGFLHGVWDGYEFCGEHVSSLNLSAAVDHTKGSGADLLQYVVVIVHALLCLDIHRLGKDSSGH